jgi:hypothetical protein
MSMKKQPECIEEALGFMGKGEILLTLTGGDDCPVFAKIPSVEDPVMLIRKTLGGLIHVLLEYVFREGNVDVNQISIWGINAIMKDATSNGFDEGVASLIKGMDEEGKDVILN